jgi:hypothetical protein
MQPQSINSAVSALRHSFTVTLDRPDLARRLTADYRPYLFRSTDGAGVLLRSMVISRRGRSPAWCAQIRHARGYRSPVPRPAFSAA